MTWVIAICSLFVAAKYGWPLGIGVWLVAWLAHSYAYPLVPCWRCKGSPKNSDAKGKHYNIYCRMCGSTGRRRRVGSLLLRGGFGKL